ncbi:MAG: hypothetical protein JWN08_532 [Frankiales bacterium]|nr:hypothetical protein [Frankiales bacterium]
MTQGDEVPLAERRTGGGERRRYNRRSAPEPGSPPYYDVFDRIAVALETIAASLSGPAPAPPTAVRPRRSSDPSNAS